jgi:23S rRNA (uracil1939-C5)-methyltransferase
MDYFRIGCVFGFIRIIVVILQSEKNKQYPPKMAKNKKPHPILTNVTITDIAAEGKAIAKVNDIVVFVPFVVPGDVVDLQVTRKKSHFMEARPIHFHSYSEKRTQAVCEHYGICGGCKWQILPYDEQLKYKQKQVVDNLTRIGKIELPEITAILGSARTEFYRNKLEFTFSNKRWRTFEEIAEGKEFDTMNAVGFHIPGQFDKVLDIEKCWLQDDISNQLRNEIRRYALEKQLTFSICVRRKVFYAP